jgi:NTE family protein
VASTPTKHLNGLILPGGGARAAYQVGVLKALADALPANSVVPFPVVAGVSAGAINASKLATHGADFRLGVAQLVELWSALTVDRIYRADARTVISTSSRWIWGLVRGLDRAGVRSLLDNQPLRELLERELDFDAAQAAIDGGAFRALAITAAGYTSARSVTYFQAEPGFPGWQRTRREGRPGRMSVEHVMASTAIPVIFPAARIGSEWHGDGSMRLVAPLSPAIHLGADRLLVIAVRNEDPNALEGGQKIPYPSFGQIAGYVLDSLFMDSIYTDLERIRRINHSVSQMPEHRSAGPAHDLRHIDARIVVPSDDIREIAFAHRHAFPRTVRTLLGLIGARGAAGRQLMSYLLFHRDYCRALIELGERDGRARVAELVPWLLGED